jgi:hypothetical protein
VEVGWDGAELIPRPPDGADGDVCDAAPNGSDFGCCCFGASVGCFSYLISLGVGGTLPLWLAMKLLKSFSLSISMTNSLKLFCAEGASLSDNGLTARPFPSSSFSLKVAYFCSCNVRA